MADFLNRLAGRALGAIPLAEPAIPTRFSSGTESNAFLASEPALQPMHLYPETSLETFEDRAHLLQNLETNPSLETGVAPPASPFPDEAPPLARSPRSHVFPRQASPPPYAESEAVYPSPERDELGKRHFVAAVNPTPDAIERLDTSVAHAPFFEPHSAPRITPLAGAIRSPVLEHSERLEAFNPLPPTVSVSIGRIEVRAEITSPSRATPVQRSRSSALSLDQFLKQVGGSAR